MCGLMLGLLIPHGETITWTGYAYNLGLATLGNTIGGAVFVAGLYWMGSPKARDQARQEDMLPDALTPLPTANGTPQLAAAGQAR